MNISVNDLLRVDGAEYRVIGMIVYRNPSDNCCWTEYRMIPSAGGREKWLSIDDDYHEYSISEMTSGSKPGAYREVDRGVQIVVSARGNVDVDTGESARFVEYEDSTEEYIFSEESWSDGTEYSKGYYLDLEEIEVISSSGSTGSSGSSYGGGYSSGGTYRGKSSYTLVFVIIAIAVLSIVVPIIAGAVGGSVPKIADWLKTATGFTYVTSITGTENQKADVYKSDVDLDSTAKAVINAVEGQTESVQQNTDDGDQSIAILTQKEYCFIYISEDGDVLVQISSRKYAYYNDASPYRSNTYSHRYYRRYYRYTGYYTDSTSYSGDTPYSGYSDTPMNTTAGDSYSTYSNSVRQESINARRTAGGGTNYGK